MNDKLAEWLNTKEGWRPHVINFSKSFVDVDSIQLTVQAGSDARYAIYDFEDAANPEDGFRIFLYTTNGTPTSGTVDFTVRGV